MITPVICHEQVCDPGSRKGKQVLEVRMDLLPPSITDLLFASRNRTLSIAFYSFSRRLIEVISPTNSRDLSKFTALRSVVVDAESSEVLATNEVTYQAKFGDEILVSSHPFFRCETL